MSKIGEWIENMVPDARDIIRRFPLAILMVAGFAVLILMKANDFDISNDTLFKLVGGTILAAYLSINLTLFGEGRGKSVSLILKACVCIAAILASYFYHTLGFTWPMAVGAAILWLGSAPFWSRARNDIAVWDFTHKIWVGVVFTITGAIIYTIGIFAISVALDSLFGVNLNDFIGDWLLPIGLAFLAPLAWMSMIPAHDEDDGDSLRNPGFISRAIGFLGTWILAPLTIIYTLILLAYIAKIIVTGTLPKGEIGQLVSPFLIIGTLTWLVLDPPFIQAKRLARWFHKLWFPLMIPVALLLALAIFIRVADYGWTLPRYLLVLTAVWALGIALWYTFRGEVKRDIRIIPGFAAFLLAIGSIGPWGAQNFSAHSQSARLSTALHGNNMLNENGYLKPVDGLILEDKSAARHAKSALEYLIDHNKAKRANKYFETPFVTKTQTSVFDLDYTIRQSERTRIMKRFGLNKVSSSWRDDEDEGVIDRVYRTQNKNIAVKGFEVFIPNNRWSSTDTFKTMELGAYSLSDTGAKIIVKHDLEQLAELDVLEWLQQQEFDGDDNLQLDPYLSLYKDADREIGIYLTYGRIVLVKDKANTGDINFVVFVKGIDFGAP